MLKLADFSAGYRKGLMVLNHLSLEVASNQIGCIVGSNGAGKTTTRWWTRGCGSC